MKVNQNAYEYVVILPFISLAVSLVTYKSREGKSFCQCWTYASCFLEAVRTSANLVRIKLLKGLVQNNHLFGFC